MKRLLRYNPALLSDEELIEGFVVRDVDLKRLLEDVRNNTTEANQHVLVIAPRGMGKTTLVRRLALEVRNDPELGQRWYPLLFGEESYEVGSTAELWLQALFHLGEQTNDSRRREAYEELRGESDDRRLRDRALAQLLDFADASGRRILLVIENLHMLLGEQLDSDEAWALRKTLQTEPRLMLLATATSRFGAIDESPQALYGFFRPHVLSSLGLEECREVWRSVSGLELDPARARPIQILTGGNVRLLAIVAAFAGKRSFRQLMEELVTLIDEHTTFFKATLEGLPPQERKVFVALAEEWRPATAKEVSERARVDVNTASSLLSRLVSRGVVEANGQEKRRKQYQVAERLFNIYYLLRRHGRAKSRIQGVVEFMVHFYAPTDLPRIAGDMANEALRFGDRRERYEALQSLLESPATAECQQDLVRSVPDELLNALKRVSDDLVRDETARTHFLRAMTLDDLSRHGEALRAFEDAIQAYSHVPDVSRDWDALGRMLHGRAQKREDIGQIEAALGGFDEALAAKSRVPVERRDWRTFGRVLGGRVRVRARLGRVADGLACLREAMNVVGTVLEAREMLIDMFIDVAAADQALEALGVLEASPGIADLEPLVVALRIVSGAPHNAPKEVVEVAHDVVQRIKERRAQWAMASNETPANAD